jgi:hypothetical protein
MGALPLPPGGFKISNLWLYTMKRISEIAITNMPEATPWDPPTRFVSQLWWETSNEKLMLTANHIITQLH